MRRRHLLVALAIAINLPGCLNRQNRSPGPFFAVKIESAPDDIAVTPSDDARIVDVWLIQDVLRMIEEEQYTGHDFGGGNRAYIDYTLERSPDNYTQRFNEAADALAQLDYTEARPKQAEHGPLPGGYYITHEDYVVAIDYAREE